MRALYHSRREDSTVERFERVLVPTDFSPLSKRALRAALTMNRRCPLAVHLLHVIPEFEVDGAFRIRVPDREEVEQQGATWAGKAFQAYLRGEQLEGVDLATAVRHGKPAEVICAHAVEVGADLVLIASHGRSGFQRAVFGSVAEKVLRLCPLPVMVVKGE